jgi:protein O-mannosyl-transferase
MEARKWNADYRVPQALDENGSVVPANHQSSLRWLPELCLSGLVLCLYIPTAYFGFVWDDEWYIPKNLTIHHWSLANERMIWTSGYLGNFAPVLQSFFQSVYSIFGSNPAAFHAAQIILHAACTCIVFLLIEKLEQSRSVAFLTAALFAVHPANVETVAWVSETKSTLAFLFLLLMLLSWLRMRDSSSWGWLLLSVAFYGLSCLSKINTVVAPLAILALEWWKSGGIRRIRARAWGAGLSLLLCALGLCLLHLRAFYHTPQTLEQSYFGSIWVHIANIPSILLFYLTTTLWPAHLSAWYTFPIYKQFDWVLVAGWATVVALVWIVVRSGRETKFWAVWFVIFLLPVLQLIPFGIWVADRYLYVPAVGLFVIASRQLKRLWDWSWKPAADPGHPDVSPRWAMLAPTIAFVVVCAFYIESSARAEVWRSNLTLWSETVKTCDRSAYCHAQLGLSLIQAGDVQRGGRELQHTIAIRSAPRYLENLGDALTFNAHDYFSAARVYKYAIEGAHSDSEADLRGFSEADAEAGLARACVLYGSYQEARDELDKAYKEFGRTRNLLMVDSLLHWKLLERDKAVELFHEAFPQGTATDLDAAKAVTSYWGDRQAAIDLLAKVEKG